MRIGLNFLSLIIVIAGIGFSSCKSNTLFVALTASETGLDFTNTITETPENNIMTYQYLYNGAGIAAGDINNDGLPDLYVCGNSNPNKLFLNKGNWKFRDITAAAVVADRPGDWKTGVTMADVNGDGMLDIYVCYSGNSPGEGFGKPVIRNNIHRANQLFINQGCVPGGTPAFIESAALFGIDAVGTFSTQAYFFDYDRDGDLDLFLLNHANTFYTPFYNTSNLRHQRHPYFGNKLYRNDAMKFTEVSDTAGIYGSGLNFGLGAAISDLNNDGWPDIYVTNDYDEQDFCYLNNGNGTFSEITHQAMGHLSKFSMGVDIADVNNDMRTDIFVADMLPEDNYRQKLLKGADQYDKYSLLVDSGFHHQNMRNTFQLNDGIGPDSVPVFREVGQLAGMSNTDWSWGPLLADFDNDGWKDLFITNGYLHDYTNLDFLKFTVDGTRGKTDGSYDVMQVIRQMPSTKLNAYAFRNKGGWQFENSTEAWGFSQKSISNAVVYADFDNDGDLDLVMNRLNDGLGIYKNTSDQSVDANYIKIKLNGTGLNKWGIGSKLWVRTDSITIFQEAFYTRGYESSVEPVMTIGLGKNRLVKEIKVQWPDGNFTILKEIPAGQMIVVDQKNEYKGSSIDLIRSGKKILQDYTVASGIDFIHHENDYVDFKSQRLLPYQLSRLGGKLAAGDVNNDGNDDIFFCGASGQAGKLFLGKDDGTFFAGTSQPWQADALCEDMNAVFFDADNDGDKDLYVVSGGNEFNPVDNRYHDRLYINSGSGQFVKQGNALPASEKSSGSCAVPGDFDNDGDLDLFVGGRLSVKNYPVTPKSFLLRNDSKNGRVQFTDITESVSKDLQSAGMVTDAGWADINKDGWKELVVAGEWMPVRIFKNNSGKGFTDISVESGTELAGGLWSRILTGDFDGDGDIDFVAGNAGTNLQLKASVKEPMQYFIQDINNDGVIDPIICYYNKGQSYPVPTLDELVEQVPSLRKKFFKYADYAGAGIKDIIGEKYNQANLKVTTLQSSFFRNNGKGNFDVLPLPANFQSSMIQAFVFDDFDRDHLPEMLCAGNFYPYNVEQGKSDSFFGGLLNISKGGILEKKSTESLWLTGDIRDMVKVISTSGKLIIVVSRNNDKAGVYLFEPAGK